MPKSKNKINLVYKKIFSEQGPAYKKVAPLTVLTLLEPGLKTNAAMQTCLS